MVAGSGIHMTSSTANQPIKSCATKGAIKQARAIFESLANPPSDVAASGNHVLIPPQKPYGPEWHGLLHVFRDGLLEGPVHPHKTPRRSGPHRRCLRWRSKRKFSDSFLE